VLCIPLPQGLTDGAPLTLYAEPGPYQVWQQEVPAVEIPLDPFGDVDEPALLAIFDRERAQMSDENTLTVDAADDDNEDVIIQTTWSAEAEAADLSAAKRPAVKTIKRKAKSHPPAARVPKKTRGKQTKKPAKAKQKGSKHR